MGEVIHWVEGRKDENYPKGIHHGHKDPTADTAIGNVMREERRRQKKSKRKKRPRIGVWRAEEAQTDAGK